MLRASCHIPLFGGIFEFRPPTHFSHMSHPTFPISHLLFLFFKVSSHTLSLRLAHAANGARITTASSGRLCSTCGESLTVRILCTR